MATGTIAVNVDFTRQPREFLVSILAEEADIYILVGLPPLSQLTPKLKFQLRAIGLTEEEARQVGARLTSETELIMAALQIRETATEAKFSPRELSFCIPAGNESIDATKAWVKTTIEQTLPGIVVRFRYGTDD